MICLICGREFGKSKTLTLCSDECKKIWSIEWEIGMKNKISPTDKAACVKLRFLGSRAAFIAYWMLPDGRTPAEATGDLELPLLLGGMPVLTVEKR